MKLSHFKDILISGLLIYPLFSPMAGHSAAGESANRTLGVHANGLAGLENRPLRFYGGAAAGYGHVSSGSEYSASPDGAQFVVGGDFSYQVPRWVFEAGGGWNYTRLNGSGADTTSLAMRTRSGYVDASTRYRVGSHWQLGPVYNYQFGTDMRLGPTVGSSSGLSLLGLKVDYEAALGRFPVRVVLQGLSSLGADGRTGTFTTLGFQVGLPIDLSSGSSAGTADSVRVSQASPLRNPVTELHVTLDARKIFFATDSSHVRSRVNGTLHRIGRYLALNPAEWGTVSLTGHADIRGTAQYNQALSKRRSESVRAVLAGAGVRLGKMKIGYHGFDRPEDPRNSPEAWAKNRRVELVFKDVRNVESLALKLKELAPLEIPGEEW